MKTLRNFMKYLLLFTFSGYVYVCLELIFRGRSDITMMFCASICAIPMIILNNIFSYETDISLQIGICAVFATLIEYMFGLIFNKPLAFCKSDFIVAKAESFLKKIGLYDLYVTE